jgi:hypothetical protein
MPLWWSPSAGLITVDHNDGDAEPVYWQIKDSRESLRHMGLPNELPSDAVPLEPRES